MANIPGPFPIGPGIAEYLRNAHHSGAQRNLQSKPAASAGRDEVKEHEIADSVRIDRSAGSITPEERHKAKDSGGHECNGGVEAPHNEKTAGTPTQRLPLFINSLDASLPDSGLLSSPDAGKLDSSPWRRSEFVTGPVARACSSDPMGYNFSQAGMAQIAQTDALQANEIVWHMIAERQKAMLKLNEIFQNLNNEVLSEIAERAMKRCKTRCSIARIWASVLGGYKLDDD